MRKRKDYPLELNDLRESGGNMASFVPLLYNTARDFRNGQKGIRNILEIGVRRGISTAAFLYGLRDRNNKHLKNMLYSIDIKNCIKSIKDKSLFPYWKFIQGDSKEVEWKDEISVLMIDGSHSYDDCLADYKKYEPFLVEGGLLFMHDIWDIKAPKKIFFDEVSYPKTILPFSKSPLGIAYKVFPPYYDENVMKLNNKG